MALSPLFVPVMLAGAIADFPREFAIWLLRNAHRLFTGASAEDVRFLYELLGVLILPSVYLFVSWWFARVLVIDKGLDFWPALDLEPQGRDPPLAEDHAADARQRGRGADGHPPAWCRSAAHVAAYEVLFATPENPTPA